MTANADGLYHSAESRGWGVLTTPGLIARIAMNAGVVDSQLPDLELLVPPLLAAYDQLPASSPLKGKLAEPIDVLREWDYRWVADSVATALAVLSREELWRTILSEANQQNVPQYEFMERQATREERLAALATVSDKLVADFGTWRTPWGDINRFQRLTSDIVHGVLLPGAAQGTYRARVSSGLRTLRLRHMTTVRIALANLRYPDTPDDSVALVVAAIADAARAAASIICFPEVYVPGYRVTGKQVPPPNPDFLESAWAEIAGAAADAGVAVVLGTERVVDGQARITTLVINADGTYAGFQDKVQLDPSEEGPYVAGAGRQVFTAGPLAFGISICHEGFRYPETVRWCARHGAHLVFHPHFSWAESGSFRPETFGDPRNTFHERAIVCRAAENTCFVASVNYATDGSPTTSVVARPDGTVLAWQAYGQEGLLVADIDTAEATGLLASRYRPV